MTDVPSYNPNEPAHPQENDWDCSVESTEWALYAWGRTPGDDWLEQSMIAAGVVDPSVGLCDASGSGLARWVNTEYGEFGYVAESVNPVSFDELAAEAATLSHPIMAGGRGWGHWTGVRGYDAARDVLLLANPANGWMGVYQEMSPADFARLGSFSMVRLTHPVAEGLVPPPDPEPPPIDYSAWIDGGKVGSGLIEMMQADGVLPAQDYSTWLPLGRMPAQIEECIAESGVVYRWLLTVSRGYRYRPE
jgi:hypothetical protein